MKIAVPDLISNSYFPAVAAAELGMFKAEGVDMTLELLFPVDKTYEAMRDHEIDFVAGSAHSALAAFPEWKGAKLICAQAQHMYWFLVVRSDLKPKRGDLTILKGKRIGAAPWVDMGLQQLLLAGGMKAGDVEIMPVPGAVGKSVNFGLTAAQALIDGKIDGFWANGMAAEIAVEAGAGTVVVDARRGEGPAGCINYTMSSIATTDELIARDPAQVAAVVRAIVRTQKALCDNPSLAEEVGKKVFPAHEAGLITNLIRRDLPYYRPEITEEFVKGMNAFSRNVGILKGDPKYNEVVATQFRNEW
ncbi:MAG: ABC transporter substrate-binding protein [Burkholderiaceae bacterium]|nr:MAG: ABC transporter substrate-binding protein [Burkholderiaceae bacterium]TAM09715.1 MAG: ABC transporter substrate-binding protein [Pusillimonas sp.]